MKATAMHDSNRNPQAEQMGDESMARNLRHQAEAIWPQEQRLFDRYGLSGPLRILDLGCGTGEITRRLGERYPQATLLGIDILEGNLAIARRDNAGSGERIRYEHGDAFALADADASVPESKSRMWCGRPADRPRSSIWLKSQSDSRPSQFTDRVVRHMTPDAAAGL